MSRINLLPASYRIARRRWRQFRIGAFVCSTLLAGELAVGLVLHARAAETRQLLAATASAQSSTAAMKKALVGPQKQATVIARQVQLAERLRSKHRWSRLLAQLARATPQRVVFASIGTDPTQWSPSLHPAVVAEKNPETPIDQQKFIGGVLLQGHAADHADLSALVAAIHASRVFTSIDVRQARREKYLNQDAISFELSCRW